MNSVLVILKVNKFRKKAKYLSTLLELGWFIDKQTPKTKINKQIIEIHSFIGLLTITFAQIFKKQHRFSCAYNANLKLNYGK